MQSAHERFRRLGNRIILIVAIVAVLTGYIGFVLASHGGPGMLVQSNGNEVGGSFRLNSLGESTVTEGDFRGTWMLVWFFDPHCPPDRCQPVLKSMEDARAVLHIEGTRVSALAVSLDARADDADGLRNYVIPVAPHVMPFTGSPAMIAAMSAEYHAPLEKSGTYYVPAPHIVVMDPAGRYAGTVDADGNASAIVAQLRKFSGR